MWLVADLTHFPPISAAAHPEVNLRANHSLANAACESKVKRVEQLFGYERSIVAGFKMA